MARTRKWDLRTDGRTGRTGVTLNALPLFFEYAGGIKIYDSCKDSFRINEMIIISYNGITVKQMLPLLLFYAE